MSELLYRGPVVGLSFHQYGMYLKYVQAGSTVFLKVKENPHDPYAVGVFHQKDNGVYEQLGWIPKGKNTDVFQFLDSIPVAYWPATVTNHDLEKSFDSRLFIQVYSEMPSPIRKPFSRKEIIETTETDKETKMNFNIDSVLAANKEAAKSAAYMEAGRMANDKAAQVLAKKAPLMVRGYVDTPVGKLVIANVAALALAQLRPNDRRAAKLTQAMQVQAYTELIRDWDIESMLDDLLSNATVKKALKTLDSAPKESEE